MENIEQNPRLKARVDKATGKDVTKPDPDFAEIVGKATEGAGEVTEKEPLFTTDWTSGPENFKKRGIEAVRVVVEPIEGWFKVKVVTQDGANPNFDWWMDVCPDVHKYDSKQEAVLAAEILASNVHRWEGTDDAELVRKYATPWVDAPEHLKMRDVQNVRVVAYPSLIPQLKGRFSVKAETEPKGDRYQCPTSIDKGTFEEAKQVADEWLADRDNWAGEKYN